MWSLYDLMATSARREGKQSKCSGSGSERRIHIVLFCFGLLVCVCIYIDQSFAECVFTLNTCNVVCVAGNESSVLHCWSLPRIK